MVDNAKGNVREGFAKMTGNESEQAKGKNLKLQRLFDKIIVLHWTAASSRIHSCGKWTFICLFALERFTEQCFNLATGATTLVACHLCSAVESLMGLKTASFRSNTTSCS